MKRTGMCMCGCGERTTLATQTRSSSGDIKGQPLRYLRGHYGASPMTGDGPNPSGLCECGCGEKTPLARRGERKWGYIAGQPLRFIRGHQHRTTVAPPEGYVVDQRTGCWNWALSLDRAGYGKAKRNGRSSRAHVLMYEQAHGAVPAGMELDHLCRNPRCCNPAHLEAVTPTENKRRSAATKLTASDVALIRGSCLSNKALAEKFCVSASNISHIRAGRSWIEVAPA